MLDFVTHFALETELVHVDAVELLMFVRDQLRCGI